MTVTTVSMKLKFPEFVDETDAAVGFALEEASRNVDSTWLPGDQDLALMYLAAHYIMVTISRRDSGEGELLASERMGEMSMTYAVPELPKAATSSDLTTTPYGTRFLELAHLNFPPVMVI
jgi:hypothetical protein